MAFDGLVVRAVVHELQMYVGGRLHKIHQPNEHDLVFTIRARGVTSRLLLSANPTYPRVHLTDRSFQNPLEAPMFCMLLRKHCENGIVESVEQIGMERMIHMTVRQRDELGDMSVKRIVIEIMGRHSNIILTDPASGIVLDAIHRVTPAISSHRIVVPGSVYAPPPEQTKRNPLTATNDEVAELLNDGQPNDAIEAIAKRLVDAYSGISPLAARAVVAVVKPEERTPLSLAKSFTDACRRIQAHDYAPNVAVDQERGKSIFSVISLHAVGDGVRTFESVSECLEFYYGDKAERDAVKQKTSDLFRFLQNEKNKNEKKLDKLKETLDEAKDADQYRMMGELLHAYLHTFERGAERVEVPNFYDEHQRSVSIELNPLLTPSENAQRYFKRYQKMKNSLTAVEEQMKHAHEEIRYLEELLQQLEGATLADIEEIRAELTQGGYIRDRGAKETRKPRKTNKPQVHSFQSSEGIPIYVGKNNTQNDYITNRLAEPSDTWLHTKDMPGSHVIIRSGTFGDATLTEAANLAAYYSKGKQSSSVPVDYTLVRHIKKPSGAKPGFVIYDKQRTLFVTPDEAMVKRMRPLKP